MNIANNYNNKLEVNGQQICWLFIIASLLLKLFCISKFSLLAEEAYYWNYAQHLDFSYLDHPPLIAVIIKLFTSLLGNNEFAVRSGSIICWLLMTFFIYKLANLIKKGCGLLVIFLLAILPFFTVQSFVMTPDQPLLVCWAATLYYLYKALILNKPKAWYKGGAFLGLGLLSKYTIILLGPATLLFFLFYPPSRFWLKRKEPYIGSIIALLFFLPVIYWNVTHEWASFIFQGSRRFKEGNHFTLHHIIGLLLLFLTPLGILGFFKLFKDSIIESRGSKVFIKIFTLFPLVFFTFFSLSHSVKFNWIGPSLLMLLPFLAVLIEKNKQMLINWFVTGSILLTAYAVMLYFIIMGSAYSPIQNIFSKYIAWDKFTHDIYKITNQFESTYKEIPLIAPLDLYNLNSEINFYQEKLAQSKIIQTKYSTIGRHIFGERSLMYNYWSPPKPTDKLLLLIAEDKTKLNSISNFYLEKKTPIKILWAYNQGNVKIRPYYYQIAKYNRFE